MEYELLSVRDAAIRVGVSQTTIRRWVKSGNLQALRAGPRLLRIKANDLDAFLSARKKDNE